MASGSNNLTSYKAKQIIGSSIAASPAGALLFTGANYTGDTWIYNYGYGGTTSPWGIFHDTTAEKLIIKGSGTDSIWVKMDTGDTYILGKVGIGYDPNTTGNNYKLYVDGDVYFDDTTYLNGNVGIGYDPATSGNTYKLYVDGDIYADDTTYLNGKVGIGYDPNTTGNSYKLYVDGSAYFNIGTSDAVSDLKFIINGNARYLSLGAAGIQAYTSANAASTLYLNFNGGQVYVGGSLSLNDHLYLAAAKNIYMNYNSTDYGVLINYNNSNTSLNACGGGIHIGYINSPYTYIFYSPDGSTRTKFFEVNSNGAYAPTRFGVNGQNTSYNLYVNGTSYFVNMIYLPNGLRTGSRASSGSGAGVEIGTDGGIEIFHASTPFIDFHYQASTSDYSVRLICDSATNLGCKGSFTATSTIYANGGYLKSTLNGNTVQIGSQNTGHCHITNSANIPFWFNNNIWLEKGKTIGGAGTVYRPFQIYLGRNSTAGSNAINAANPLIEFSNGDRSQYGQLIYTDYDSVRAPDGLTWVGNQANSWFQAPRVFGAVWNDYAEYRETKEEIQPGRCVVETGKGDLILSTERLQAGCEIVSDTFGFAIGETATCKTPTACAGRVLAYLYEDNSLAKPGDPVCSGPDGTVSLMTHEEEIEWPSRIIATISEIPDYEEWEYGSADEFGNKEKLKVNGRIWIRIR